MSCTQMHEATHEATWPGDVWWGSRSGMRIGELSCAMRDVCCVSGREELMGLEESRYASPRTVTRLSGGRRSSVLMRLSRFEERKSKMCGA